MSVYDDGEHVYVPPPPTYAPYEPSVSFLEWLTLGKLSVILITFSIVLITIVSVLAT